MHVNTKRKEKKKEREWGEKTDKLSQFGQSTKEGRKQEKVISWYVFWVKIPFPRYFLRQQLES